MKINPAEHAVKLTTTLNLLRNADACAPLYKHLVEALGGPSFDHDAPINLLTVLETNGLEDCLWALQATAENSDKVARLLAADFAESVLGIYERQYPGDDRPRQAIGVARQFALGSATKEQLDAAWDAADAAWNAADAARAAALVAAWNAARVAAWDAADAAWNAADAAWNAARVAAWDAADAAGAAQIEIVKSYLLA